MTDADVDAILAIEAIEEERRQADFAYTPVIKSQQEAAHVKLSKESASEQSGAGGSTSSAFFGLPEAVEKLYRARGIRSLYSWQQEVLTRADVVAGGNLVYSLPTSGGKTLVAEILCMRSVVSRKLSSFLVVPFVSVADEKLSGLRAFADAMGFGAEGYYGTQGRLPTPRTPSIFVCTIEKANSVINNLAEEGRLAEVGTVVVDELHMLGESNRGATLELFLLKILMGCRNAQVVGMSATIPNLPDIARWLRAACYQSTFRPVPLQQHLVCQGSVYVDGVVQRCLAPGTDLDCLIALVLECAPENSVLVFCASRAQCVELAGKLASHIEKRAASARKRQADALLQELAALSSTHSGSTLAETMPYGVAYHHGGLLMEEREIIERAFRSRILSILCCTSTLAAGVNLPARRVIFKSPYIGKEFLTKSRYLQMAGRAGRAGLDPFGEAFLMLSPADRLRGQDLLVRSIEPSLSQVVLSDEQLARILLESAAFGVLVSTSRLSVVRDSLLARFTEQIDLGVLDVQIRHCYDELVLAKFFEVKKQPIAAAAITDEDVDDDDVISVTPFGTSAVRSCFGIDEAILVREELELLLRDGLILGDDLHICYFLTPVREVTECDWSAYRRVLSRLPSIRQRIAERLQVDERFVDQRAMGIAKPTGELDLRELFTTRRFFFALMMCDVLNEVSMPVVEETYAVTRGQLQSLMKSASMFSSSITAFCGAMGWHSLEAVFAAFVKRLGFGVKPDIVPLMEIKGIQPPRARSLWLAGFKSVVALATADPTELVKRVKEANPNSKSAKFFTLRSATAVVREANRLLLAQIRERRGELTELTLASRGS